MILELNDLNVWETLINLLNGGVLRQGFDDRAKRLGPNLGQVGLSLVRDGKCQFLDRSEYGGKRGYYGG